ncbi:MAG: protein BatD [Verrucomicrobia bacterium]|nr:protein BatD [Verrucomicrobiota bacterium]
MKRVENLCRRLAVVVCCLFLVSSVHAVTFSASLDRTTLRVGEQAVLTLRFDGGQPSGVPRLPDVANLRFQGPGQSQQISIINGQRTASLLLTYSVTPLQPGDYTIPAFQVPIAGASLPSSPLALKVLPANAKIPDSEAFRQFTFAKISAGKTNVFLGEPFLVEVRLYLTRGGEIQMPVLRSDGFTLTPFQHQQGQEQVGNAQFSVIIFRAVATAVRPGTIPLGPAQCSFNLHISTDRFDIFGRGVRAQPVSIVSEPLDILVQPLPAEGRPADFNGAVGSFQMSASASPVDVAVGDPITVRVQVRGRGGLDGVRMPPLDLGESFKSYPPSVTTEMPDPISMTGLRKLEQVVQPQSADVKELPAFSLSFFDPDARAYRTLKQPATPLRVRAAAAAQAPTVVMTTTNAAAAAAAATELVHIKPHLGVLQPAGAGALRRPAFWLMSGVPFALWLTLLTRRKLEEKLARNPRLRRRREVEKLVNAGLAGLRQQAAAAQSEAFVVNLFRLLQEQLGERLDLPASAITEEVIDERVRPMGAGDVTCQSLHALFQICNAARYAPVRETSELAKLAEQFAATVEELRKLEASR